MPFYDYRCQNCKTTFEISKGMNEIIATPACPNCKKNQTQRIFSGIRLMRPEGSKGSECNTCSDGVCSNCAH